MVKTMAKKTTRLRSVRLVRPPDETGVGVFCLTSGQKSGVYVFKEIPCAIGGRGFALHRLGLGILYHARVGAPEECDCDCLGFLAHGSCKHVLGLKALVEHGLV